MLIIDLADSKLAHDSTTTVCSYLCNINCSYANVQRSPTYNNCIQLNVVRDVHFDFYLNCAVIAKAYILVHTCQGYESNLICCIEGTDVGSSTKQLRNPYNLG